MQIQYNITRLEEWCKSHDIPEGALQLEHLMQATKLLQLKKATLEDIHIIYDVCWMLTPTQIQKLITNYYVADYEVSEALLPDIDMCHVHVSAHCICIWPLYLSLLPTESY